MTATSHTTLLQWIAWIWVCALCAGVGVVLGGIALWGVVIAFTNIGSWWGYALAAAFMGVSLWAGKKVETTDPPWSRNKSDEDVSRG